MLLLFPVCHQLINAPCFLLLYNKIFLRFLLLELTSYLLKYMYLYRRTNYLYQYIRSEAYMSYLDLLSCPGSFSVKSSGIQNSLGSGHLWNRYRQKCSLPFRTSRLTCSGSMFSSALYRLIIFIRGDAFFLRKGSPEPIMPV